MNARRIIFSILAVGWMAVIFLFSSANGDESESFSTTFGRTLCRFFVPEFEKLSADEQESLIEKIDYPIRKLAHFTEYMILGFFLAGALVIGMEVLDKKRLFLSWLLVAAYSITDELHQLFVAGRSGRILDVFIDSSGGLLAVFLFAIIQKLVFVQNNES